MFRFAKKEIPDLSWDEMDVRELEGHFLPAIVSRAKALKEGEGLRVIQSFEPKPLYSVMSMMGFGHFSEEIEAELFHTYFYIDEHKLASLAKRIFEKSKKSNAKDGRVDVVMQSATPIAIPIIEYMKRSERIVEHLHFTEIKIWEETEKHLPWIMNGKADISFSAIMASANLVRRGKDAILHSVDIWDNFSLVTRRKDITEFSQLKGEPLYLPLFSKAPPAAVTRKMIEAEGLDPKDFQFHYGPKGKPFGRPEEIAQKLVDGEIEFGLLREPELSFALAGDENLRVAISYGDLWRKHHPKSIGLPNAGLVFKRSFAEANPEAVKVFVEVMAEAIEFTKNNPEGAARLSYKAMGRSLADMTLFLKRAHFRHVKADDVQDQINEYLTTLGLEVE
ncbi:DUF2249 domain-containing protein [Myxococcota bacterium]|nr:DUF2249 domain-containing protein [Myxococcota bacterium]